MFSEHGISISFDLSKFGPPNDILIAISDNNTKEKF